MDKETELKKLEDVFGRDLFHLKVVVGTVLAALLAAALVLGTIQSNELIAKYPIVTIKDQIEGKVTSIDRERGCIRIDMENGTHWQIYLMYDMQGSSRTIESFLREGDIIDKRAYSDTLRVNRFGETFYFELIEN